MQRLNRWLNAGLMAAGLAAIAPLHAQAAPQNTVGSCSNAVVMERHYGQPHAVASGAQVEEIYLTLSDGQHLDGPAALGTTGFFWDYTPGNKVGVCVEALQPLRLRVDDRITGASFVVHPTAAQSSGS